MAEEQTTKVKNGTVIPRICPRCDFNNRPDGVFCANCGAHLIGKPCPACKALNPDNVNYCDRCGTWLDKPAEQRGFLSRIPINAPIVVAVLALIVVVGAVFQLLLAILYPGPLAIVLGMMSAGLLAVGLILGAVYGTMARTGYSR